MPVTPKYGFPFPAPSDANDPPADFQALALSVESRLANKVWSVSRPGTQDNFAAGAFTSVTQLSLPANAPQGDYLVSYNVSWSTATPAASVGYVRGMFGDVAVTRDMRVDHAGPAVFTGYTDRYTHPGGVAVVELFLQMATQAGSVFAAGTGIAVAFIG